MSRPSKLDEAVVVIKGLLYADDDWNDRAEAFLAKVGTALPGTALPAPAPAPAPTVGSAQELGAALSQRCDACGHSATCRGLQGSRYQPNGPCDWWKSRWTPKAQEPKVLPPPTIMACPDCGAVFQATDVLNGSAAFKLATHVRFSAAPHPKARAAGIR